MVELSLLELSIRDGVVRQVDTGYILACDPELEEQHLPHTHFFKWNAGVFQSGSLNFNAHSICIISNPEVALVMIAGFGEYGITTVDKRLSGNIFGGQRNRSKYGMFRVVSEIEGKAYAVGLRGMVYRLDHLVKWVRIDNGLPSSFDITAIDGFGARDIYAVGYSGAIWHYDGRAWSRLDLPTNVNLNAVKCAGDSNVYIGGYDGTLICGRDNTWNIIATNETNEAFWDLEWYGEELYVASISLLYCLKDGGLELVDFDNDPPETCYHLSRTDNIMWSIGARDIMSFDGKKWKRIV